MKIFPAIDLIDGQAVRLERGDYSKKTVYGADPVKTALSFVEAGAEYLHVVDLDGAKSGERANETVIRRIINETPLKVEVGGGIRTEESIDAYLEAGAFRVILGTAAATDENFVKNMCEKYADKIAVGADIKDGEIAIKGWTQSSGEDAFDFCRRMEKLGVGALICTDISKDGLLSGTNLGLYRRLSDEFSADVVASGGISSLSDVEELVNIGVYGAILGRALYTGDLSLAEAIKICGE